MRRRLRLRQQRQPQQQQLQQQTQEQLSLRRWRKTKRLENKIIKNFCRFASFFVAKLQSGRKTWLFFLLLFFFSNAPTDRSIDSSKSTDPISLITLSLTRYHNELIKDEMIYFLINKRGGEIICVQKFVFLSFSRSIR